MLKPGAKLTKKISVQTVNIFDTGIKGGIKIDLTGTKYRVIRECAQELDWEITDDKYDDSSLKERRKNQIADLCWYDLPIDSSKLS